MCLESVVFVRCVKYSGRISAILVIIQAASDFTPLLYRPFVIAFALALDPRFYMARGSLSLHLLADIETT